MSNMNSAEKTVPATGWSGEFDRIYKQQSIYKQQIRRAPARPPLTESKTTA
jgi:hypothetical protein